MLQGPGISESLQDVLQLTDQDIADRLDISHPLTAYALFKIWKEKQRPSVFNYRTALAHELRRIQMPGLADEIAAGKYMKERTSLAFIEDMVQGLKQDKLHSLGNIIKLSGTDVHWPTNTPIDVISKEVHAWVAKWTSAMATWRRFNDTTGSANVVASDPGLGPWTYGRINKTIPHEHRDLNDRLVENGFLDLAREIMIIEQRSVAGLLT
ncbi:uncharacterized protein LOC115928806 [Strongylocentrotus purpuratus]|uniref:Uncharacterized protein n=1 Tax=Strongylocentrotus purpuratus TaxID=7668 RepID=A0A7M7PJG8_STRPU|nr:uncharacterized protein LOC115928806 [Strongylocentrotus purpuratus]